MTEFLLNFMSSSHTTGSVLIESPLPGLPCRLYHKGQPSDEYTSMRMSSWNPYKCKQVFIVYFVYIRPCRVVVACLFVYPFFYTTLCYCLFISLSPYFCCCYTYIIGHCNASVRIIDLVAHTTYVVCVNFIDKWL